MIPMRMASIGGFSSSRGSLFHVSATDSFHLGSPSMSPTAGLGADTAQGLYEEAKKQIATFDSLLERTKRIGNKAAREQIISDFGLDAPTNNDKALYMRNATAFDVTRADSYTPINYLVFTGPGPSKNRPRKLREFNKDFSAAVKNAEDTYGSLPEPVVIERTTTVSQTPGWVVPVAIGALAVAGLAAFGVFSGK